VLDGISQEKKKNMSGQMSLFDFASEEEKEDFEVRMPDVGEFDNELLLAFEKEVLGIYVSGHPMGEYEQMWRNNITRTSMDFAIEEESDSVNVADGEMAVIGGIITSKTIKTTRNNSMMAFITIEDLTGVVEVIIFPRDYEKSKNMLIEDNKVFIKGKVTVEEDKPAKLICQEITPFDQVSRELWIKFSDKENFMSNEQKLYQVLCDYDGNDEVCIFLECEKAIKRLPKSKNIKAEKGLIERLGQMFSPENIKLVEKSIEKRQEKR
jgi:DNA polymerase-3 subunit alpha